MSIDKLKTKFFTGAWLTDVKHYFSKINEIIDYLNDNPVDARPYKVYTALLSQTGTDAPIATILENTLGFTPIFKYYYVGQYTINYTGGFPKGKTFILNNEVLNTVNTCVIEGNYSNDELFISVCSEGVLTDELLSHMRIEIRVYN